MSSSDDPTDDPFLQRGGLAGSGGTPVPVDVSSDRARRRIWVVFLGGPVVWFVHFMIVYLAAEAGCTGGGPGFDLFDPPVPVVLTLIATVVAVGLCIALIVWAYRWWRADGGRGSLAFAGLLLIAFSAIAVLFTAAPATAGLAC